jgi:phosphate transport system substrate-binding protein
VKVSTTSKLAGVVVLGALSLAACGSDSNNKSSAGGGISCAAGDLKGAGSTFQKNIVAEWIKDYTAACSGATLDYQGIGSGAGIKQFGEGTIDFAGSDSVMKPDEQTAADAKCGSKAIHLPVTAGGIAVAYNLPSVKDLQLSAKTLSGIFQGTITKWDDAAIKADNTSATLPSTAITAVHRDDSSGTTKVFSSFLAATDATDWKLGSDKELKWPAGVQGAKGSDGVTQAVAGAEGGITYVEKSFVDSSTTLAAAKIGTSDGGWASLDGVTDALAGASVTQDGNDIQVKVDYAAIKGTAYPITTVSYEIVCTKGKDAAKQTVLKSFLTYAVGKGQDSADATGYAPLPTDLAGKVKTAIAALS